ncbi:MAG: DegV family protein [Chloroflexi bacterium]|nr:DegV family protein [Chloroflexota bacterium]MBU1747013.1 DegV family protein [Chloroflexota bacterium]
MQIVTDSGTDVCLSPEQMAALGVHIVPLVVTLEGKSYREGVDIEPGEFYRLLAESDSLPVTSQPSAGDFAETYRRLAATDPDILSIHMTSGLSGTFNSAQAGAQLVPEANVTHVDTKTLSAAAGWQVEAAARALNAGWSLEEVLALLDRIGAASESMYTLKELKYLIHGGRISHMKGLIASVLNLKPLIGVEKENGTYVQQGQVRTFQGAVKGLVDVMARQHAPGSALRVQVLHAYNPEGASMLREQIDQRFDCTWLPVGPMSLVLGAHTGPSMVGVAYAPLTAFADVP